MFAAQAIEWAHVGADRLEDPGLMSAAASECWLSRRALMRALVTGGCGFVGASLCRRLSESGDEVIALDDLSLGPETALGRRASARRRRHPRSRSRRLIAEHRPQVVFHLAAIHFIPDCERDPARAVAVNVEGTQRVLDAAHGRRCRRGRRRVQRRRLRAQPRPPPRGQRARAHRRLRSHQALGRAARRPPPPADRHPHGDREAVQRLRARRDEPAPDPDDPPPGRAGRRASAGEPLHQAQLPLRRGRHRRPGVAGSACPGRLAPGRQHRRQRGLRRDRDRRDRPAGCWGAS